MSNVFASSRFGGGGGGFGSSQAGGAVVQDVATQLVNTVKQVSVIATAVVQDVATQLVNTIKQVGVIATVPSTMGTSGTGCVHTASQYR
jgi:hypothetical protein